MDVEDAISHLEALRKVYALTQTHIHRPASEILDENARNVLKNLLDAAIKKAINGKAEVIAAAIEKLMSILVPRAGPTDHENSVSGSVLGNQKKNCKVCQKNTVKKLANSADGDQNSSTAINFQKDRNDNYVRKSDQHVGTIMFDKLRRYVSSGRYTENATSDIVEPSLNKPKFLPDEASGGTKQGEASIKVNLVPKGKPIFERNQSRVKAIIQRIESGKWVMDKDNDDDFIPIHAPANDEILKDMKKHKNYGHARFPPVKPSSSDLVNSASKVYVHRAGHHVSPIRGGHHSNKKRRNKATPIIPLRHFKSESSITSSLYFSSGTSDGNHNYHSASEKYSSSSSVTNTAAISTSSTGGTTTTPSKLSSEYGSYESNSTDSDVNSSSGYEAHQSYAGSAASATEVSSSSYSSPIHRPMESKKSGRAAPRKISKQINGLNSKKAAGTLRKLKDRLGMIFHQYVHHNIHHNHRSRKADHQKGKSSISSRAARAYEKKAETFLSSRAAKANYEKKAVKKIQKSALYGKKDESHFPGLMGAVLSHIRRSKKSKSEENGFLPDVVKKAAKKKSQWANITKKVHKKLGVGKAKTRFKTLPKIK